MARILEGSIQSIGRVIMFCLVVIMMAVFLINALSGKQGTYKDYTLTIVDLWAKPFVKKTNLPFESKGEKECRRVLEKYTGLLFPKQRPSFLRNHISDHVLELDCFNDSLKIAVEYNGEQHYKFIPYFHTTKDSFYNLKYKDDIKQRLCKEHNVKLIVVPYTVPLADIEAYILNELNA